MTRFIPDYITELSMCEIFVFGSNLEGEHYGGAARTAYEKFGAEWGVGNGPTGQCYAIPTMHGGVDKIKPYVDEFVEYAKQHPNNRFLVTRIGCGIAGFKDEDIAPLFKEARKLPNVNFSVEWLLILDNDECIDSFLFGIVPKTPVISIPDALTESDLKRLCEKYKYVIGSGVIMPSPQIRIRYVVDKDRFEYANFGDFYICEDGELYVWTHYKDLAYRHNQDLVEDIFGDECKERNKYFVRAIFAGVKTPFTDSNGRQLYTGDVLRVWLKGYDDSIPKTFKDENSNMWAFGTLGENEENWKAIYACVLDNHCVTPDMFARIERCGTVFHQLEWNEEPIEVARRCFYFQDLYGESHLTEKDKMFLAKYTPNFDQELWKYHALDIIGAEFKFK